MPGDRKLYKKEKEKKREKKESKKETKILGRRMPNFRARGKILPRSALCNQKSWPKPRMTPRHRLYVFVDPKEVPKILFMRLGKINT